MEDILNSLSIYGLCSAVITIAVVLITILLIKKSSWFLCKESKEEDQLTCPGLKSTHPVYGNLTLITPHGGLHKFLLEHHQKLGPIFSFYWEKELAVSLASPVLWKEVVTLFDRPEKQFDLFRPLIGDYSIQYMNGNVGMKQRQIHNRYFSFSAIKEYFQLFLEIGNELVERWGTFKPDQRVPLRLYMMEAAMKAITRASYGDDYLKTHEELVEIKTAYDTCWDDMESRLDGNFPEKGSERQIKFDTALQLLKTKIVDILNHRRELKEKTKVNFIDVLLEEKNLYENDQQLIDTLISYFIGGFHTTGNSLVWIIYYLNKNPDVERKVLEEIERFGDEELTMEGIEKLTYLHQVIDESLRCSVLAPYAARYSDEDIVVGGHIIPKKTPIILALGAVLKDPDIWPEPDRFDPDRFSPEETKKRHPLAFQPFGFAGKRKCPGYRFSYCEAAVFLFKILKNFKVSLVEGQNVQMIHRLVTMPKEEIFINVSPVPATN